ncbi:MAG: hypothetical protein K8R11_06970 [Methanococcoides sp.]|nr:hypothetical protein [Methanococcoides sp.]
MSATDIRLQRALGVIDSNHNEIQLFKTTRAGATTSLCLASLLRNLKFLIVVPTNKIIKDTILGNVRRLSQKENPNIIHIPSNFECILNKEKIEENEYLSCLPYLPLPNGCGDECKHYDKCSVTKIFRDEDYDGIAITYHKLVATMKTAKLYPESNASEILDKLFASDIVIFDEAHNLAFDEVMSLDMTNNHDFGYAQYIMRKLNKSKGEYKNLRKLIFNYIQIIKNKDVLEQKKLLNTHVDDKEYSSYSKNQSCTIPNPKKNIAFIDRNTKPYYNRKTDKYEISETEIGKKSSKILQELISLIDCHKSLKISTEDISFIINIINIVKTDKITLHSQKIKNKNTYDTLTDICTVNEEYLSVISEFLKTKQFDKKSKIIVTSATFTYFNYSGLFKSGTDIHKYNFGDPLNTNDKLTILCDTKSYSAFGRNSTYNCRIEIQTRCKQIMNLHGSNNCLIICRNISEYIYWKDYWENYSEDGKKPKYTPQVTYYRAPDVMGVDSEKRVCILIGLGHLPAHACDPMRDSAEKAQVAREEMMHIEVFQALSRVKDPNGKEKSIVFALGCVERDILAIVTWGIDRGVEIINPDGQGQSKYINVRINGEEISRPKHRREVDWKQTLIRSILCKNYLNSLPFKHPYNTYYYGRIENNEFEKNSKSSLLDLIIGDNDVSVRKKSSKKDMILTDKLLAQHIDGDHNLSFKFLMPENKVNCVMFETPSEYNISALKLSFDSINLPYVIEKIGSSYRLWMLINESKANVAKLVYEKILKDIGFILKGKNKSFESYPKNTKINLQYKSSDKLIEMPFGKNSKVLVNGEFVDDFKELTVGIVNIDSIYEIILKDEAKAKAETKANPEPIVRIVK